MDNDVAKNTTAVAEIHLAPILMVALLSEAYDRGKNRRGLLEPYHSAYDLSRKNI